MMVVNCYTKSVFIPHRLISKRDCRSLNFLLNLKIEIKVLIFKAGMLI